NLLNLHAGRIGVMIGDVTSHGFGAALIMAQVMAASGIHAESAETPGEVLRRIEQSLAEELARTEMFLTLCYAVVDPGAERLHFANAGHPHAFLVAAASGAATRLGATRPPLGVPAAAAPDGARFGEERVLGHVTRLRERPAREILESVFADLAGFTGGAAPHDDRTVVILKA